MGALRRSGVTSFEIMQNASDSGAGALVYFAFDLIKLDGGDITGLPLLERKGRLATILKSASAGVAFSEHEGATARPSGAPPVPTASKALSRSEQTGLICPAIAARRSRANASTAPSSSSSDGQILSRHRTRWRTYHGRIDHETRAKTSMTRLCGWPPRGKRLVDKVPHGHWKTATFLAALRNDRLEAPCLFGGPVNGQRFLAYIEQFLVPTLRPGDIRDPRQSRLPQRQSRATGDPSRRSPPRVPPQVLARPEPIEQVFAKLKGHLRRASALAAIKRFCLKTLEAASAQVDHNNTSAHG
jgi:hypothetical protein